MRDIAGFMSGVGPEEISAADCVVLTITPCVPSLDRMPGAALPQLRLQHRAAVEPPGITTHTSGP